MLAVMTDMRDYHVHLINSRDEWGYIAEDLIRDMLLNDISSAYVFGDPRWPEEYSENNMWVLEQTEFARTLVPGIRVQPFFLLSPETLGQFHEIGDNFDGVKLHLRYINFPYFREPRKTRVIVSDILDRETVKMLVERNMPVVYHTGPDEHLSNPNDLLDLKEQYPELSIILAHFCRFDKRAIERVAELPNTYIDVSPMGVIPECIRQGLWFSGDYDIIPTPEQRMAAIASSLPPEKVLFGSDVPLFRMYGGTYEAEIAAYRKLLCDAYGQT
jgi:hypothetical protein